MAAPALVAYVNAIPVGLPMLTGATGLGGAFAAAVAPILPGNLLTSLLFQVSLNGTPVSPTYGSDEIQGDPESYFYAQVTGVAVLQG